MAANRINQWWMCCQTKEAQNEMLESLFFQYNVKDQQDKLFMSDLVKALMPRPPAPPSQFSPALLRSFVTFFCKIQMKRQKPVEARDQVKNMGQLGQLDSCHGEKVPKPGGGSNLPNGIFVLLAKVMLCYVLEIPMDYYGLFRAFAIGQ